MHVSVRLRAIRLNMLSSQALNAVGLGLDIVGFFIVFVTALPVVMRRNFVTSDRVDVDGVRPDSSLFLRLQSPGEADRLAQQRKKRETVTYITGGVLVMVGFMLQLVALFVP